MGHVLHGFLLSICKLHMPSKGVLVCAFQMNLQQHVVERHPFREIESQLFPSSVYSFKKKLRRLLLICVIKALLYKQNSRIPH